MPHRDHLVMANERYVIMTVECSNCKTKQKIHVAVRPGFSKKADERISCINCGDQFKGSIPDKIIHGPFPA
jgi:ribosomal protein S27E